MSTHDLNKTEQELLRAMRLRGKAIERWDARIEALRAKVAKKCRHVQTVDFHYEHDDGYGRQTKCIGKRCVFCEKKNYYPGMSEQWT